MSESLGPADLERIFESVKNWGRWGAEDERGALGFIDDAKRARAAALVRDGVAVSCSLEFPVTPGPDNPTPAQHHMVMAGDAPEGSGVPYLETALDYIGISFHGMATSHIDALCHVFVRGQMYNGFPASDVKSTGALRNSIMAARDGIVSRGVLLDIPRLRGVAWLELGDAIERAELEAAERAQNVRVEPGDVLLIATGRDALRAMRGPWEPVREGLAGLHPSCIPYLHERRIAVLGSDGISDPLPPSPIEGWPIPVHQCCLVAMGVHLLDNLELGRLSAACRARERWEFLLAIAPLRIERATGSPVNPIALF
jgi:kynurenine formamidase